MTTDLDRIEAQLQKSFEGDAWHGPSVLEALDGVTAEAAHAHPIPRAHSIWELVLHLAGTYRIVLRRLQSDGRPMAADEDWPAIPQPTDANWTSTVRALRDLNAELRRAVRHFDAKRLDQPLVPEPGYSAYVQFIGVTQHDLYHAGQIVLLKRALASVPPGSVRL